MWYEIWDRETGNLLLDADNERELLDSVAATVAEYGDDAVRTWFLVRGDATERTGTIVAEGNTLAHRALPVVMHSDD